MRSSFLLQISQFYTPSGTFIYINFLITLLKIEITDLTQIARSF